MGNINLDLERVKLWSDDYRLILNSDKSFVLQVNGSSLVGLPRNNFDQCVTLNGRWF